MISRSAFWAPVLLATLAAAVAASEPGEKVPPHLAEARALLAEVAPGDSSYRHKDTLVLWSEPGKKAECHTDCSGLLNSLIEKTHPGAEKAFPKWFGKRRPLAEDYHDAIAAGRGFHKVKKVADIRPGDVLASRFPPEAKDTGHVMLVDSVPVPRESTKPVVDGTRQWELTIIDSTASPHGKGDTRHNDDGTHRTGLGRGTIRLYSHADGTLAGYCWSTGSASEFRPIGDRPLAVGRLE